MTLTIALAIAIAFLIVSFIIAAIYGQWINPLVWIGWAFGPLIGR